MVCHDAAGRVLLARRAIEPRREYWNLPAGFLECGESAEAGARRELAEEVDAAVAVAGTGLLAVMSIPRISQLHMWFCGALDTEHKPTTLPTGGPRAPDAHMPGVCWGAGEETLETRLFAQQEVPWPDLAFPTTREALRLFFSLWNGGGGSLDASAPASLPAPIAGAAPVRRWPGIHMTVTEPAPRDGRLGPGTSASVVLTGGYLAQLR